MTDTANANAEICTVLASQSINKDALIERMKAEKNIVEQRGMRDCHIRDMAALVSYFAWLEEQLKNPAHGLNEYTAALKLEEFRSKGDKFKGLSFETISSIGPNGAVIHYAPSSTQSMPLNNDEIYLCDAGAQYLDGTTDCTRTIHFGGKAPTDFQKEAYTRVLLGVLSLERLVWPSNSNFAGGDMDTLARMHLWEKGLDYAHGTGHGVGSFLYVHEGPQGIGRYSKEKIVEGMCVSDEPGYYKDGEFGIRIENIIMCQKHPQFENFYLWENLTVAPYNRALIDLSLLSADVRQFIDTFHQKCLLLLTPYIKDDALAMAWVKRECAPL